MKGGFVVVNAVLLVAYLVVAWRAIAGGETHPLAIAGMLFIVALLVLSTVQSLRPPRPVRHQIDSATIDDPPDPDDGEEPAPSTPDEVAMKERMLLLIAQEKQPERTRRARLSWLLLPSKESNRMNESPPCERISLAQALLMARTIRDSLGAPLRYNAAFLAADFLAQQLAILVGDET